ncbi:hypothetical protein B6259_06645 [Ruminococcaceae bacterium CPB6]|nr:hypothetical protein B6259_06645 [Ruminococcaceae bacterium CPB6]
MNPFQKRFKKLCAREVVIFLPMRYNKRNYALRHMPHKQGLPEGIMGKKDYSKIGQEISHAVREAMRAADFENIGRTVEDNVKGFADDINEVFGGPGSAGHRPPHPYAPPTPPKGTPDNCPPNGQRPPQQPIRPSYSSPNLHNSRIPGAISGMTWAIAGLVMGVPLLIADIAMVAAAATGMVAFSEFMVAGAVTFSMTAAAFFAVGHGIRKRRQVRRFRRYRDALDGAAFGMVDQLADSAGETHERAVKDLKKMIMDGVYPQGHLDKDQTCFMIDDETYQAYLDAEKNYNAREEAAKEKEEKKKENPQQAQLEEVRQEGNRYLQEIQAANDAIPGKEVSAKLDKLEQVTGRIFQCVEQHPEKLPEIRRFMRYYLPTTLKLVKSYQEFDTQPVQGENITKAKQEIERSLDTINTAFANLLDSLFANDVLDVSADISTLETMLKQEGLTGSDFTPKQPKMESTEEK